MRTQRGVGLIEMMVALTIGLFLLLGLGVVFQSMNQTFTLRQQLSTLQDNERMAMSIMGTSIHNAGFRSNLLNMTAAAQFPSSAPFAAAQILSGLTGAPPNPDTIYVRFAAGSTSNQGCSATLTSGDLYTDVFTVSSGYLTCQETDNTTGAATTLNLIAGLSGMTVLYGVDTTGVGSVTEYLTATATQAAAQWASVKTIKITLIFKNPLQGQPGQSSTISLTQTMPLMVGL